MFSISPRNLVVRCCFVYWIPLFLFAFVLENQSYGQAPDLPGEGEKYAVFTEVTVTPLRDTPDDFYFESKVEIEANSMVQPQHTAVLQVYADELDSEKNEANQLEMRKYLTGSATLPTYSINDNGEIEHIGAFAMAVIERAPDEQEELKATAAIKCAPMWYDAFISLVHVVNLRPTDDPFPFKLCFQVYFENISDGDLNVILYSQPKTYPPGPKSGVGFAVAPADSSGLRTISVSFDSVVKLNAFYNDNVFSVELDDPSADDGDDGDDDGMDQGF